ncbi:MAG: hypothetical protein WCX93_02070 [Burkholderiaceae bacterium]
MPAYSPLAGLAPFRTPAILLALAVLAGCAQPQQSSALYDTSRENTKIDAESHAMGGTPRAASQIQLGFGGEGPAQVQRPAPAAASQEAAQAGDAEPGALPRPLAEARSFLGTVPCPSGMACEAARFLVTLAPSGEWRSRTTTLVGNQPRHTMVEQGCWDVIGDSPLRIALVHANQDTAKADMTFVNNNTLRVHTLNGVQPMLEHRLARQADIDPIDELKSRPALNCL